MAKRQNLSHLLGCAAIALAFLAGQAGAASIMTIKKADGGRYDVFYAGKLFTSLHTQGFPKPILYPLHGPNGEVMVRHYPMKKGVKGERSDHPHHQSLWFTHGDVNGVSFWHIGSGAGKIVTTGNGVKIVGHLNVAGRVAASASLLYAKNLFAFLETLVDKSSKQIAINREDELVKATLLTDDGKVVHPNFAKVDQKPQVEPAAIPASTMVADASPKPAAKKKSAAAKSKGTA